MFLLIGSAIEERARLRFERETTEAKALIDLRIQFYTNVLYGLRGLFATQPEVSRLDFHRFVESLDIKQRYPGFDLVNFAAYVTAADRRAFEEAVRRDTTLDPKGYPAFSIRPPGERPEYHVLVYLEPMARFRFAFGLDVAANPVLGADPQELVALQHDARDSGNLIASGRPIRVKANPDYTGLAMRLAAYRSGGELDTVAQRRAAFVGTVGAGFNVQNLMKDALSADRAKYLRFRLFDVGPSETPGSRLPLANERLLFDSQQIAGAEAAQATSPVGSYFTRDLTTVVGGRLWQMRFDAPHDAVVDRVDTTVPWFVLSGGLLSTLLLTGFLSSLASSQRRAVALASDMTKDLRESQKQLSALSRRLVEVQEAERRQLARELHDRVGQNLTALSINLNILTAQVPADSARDSHVRLQDSTALVESTADAIDDVMTELRPPMLDDYGLLSALQWYTKDFSRRTGLPVKVSGPEPAQRPASNVEITLFRIAQEALTNVAKHARATRVDITLEGTASGCKMTVRDDGVGFTAKEGAPKKDRQGLGMVTMRERAQAVGGTCDVTTAPGRGTIIEITVAR